MSDSEQTAGVANSDLPAAVSAVRIYGVVLSVGIVCALAIVSVYEITRPIIERNRIALRERAILDILPGATTSRAFQVDEATRQIEPAPPGADEGELVFAGFADDGQLVGLAIEARGMGYQDVIRLLYGYSFAEQAVIGISVLESRETPGLGDRIEKDADYLSNFQKLDVRLDPQGNELANRIAFVKPGEKTAAWQIDGITGATISSEAVADMISESTAHWIPAVHDRQDLFTLPNQETK